MSQELALVPSQGGLGSIQRSENLRRALNTKVMQVEKSIVANKAKVAQAAMGARQAVKEAVQQRIKDNTHLSKVAEARVRVIDESIKDTGLWVTRVAHERYKQFAAMKVTERRLLIREEIPPEFAKDNLNEALELELKILKQARQEFFDMEEKVKRCIKDLQAVRQDLSKDSARRRIAVSADNAVLVNVALAGAVAPGARSVPGEQTEVAVITEDESRQLRILSERLEEEAKQLRKRAKSCISCIRDECVRANVRVEERLVKRTEETTMVTKKLIGQGKEVDYTILSTQRSLTLNKKIADMKDQKTVKSFSQAENTLAELMRSRQDLSSDLRSKTILLSTSEACRKVTPQTASSPAAKRPNTAQGATRTRPRGTSHSQSTPSLPALTPTSQNGNMTLDNPQAQTPTAFEQTLDLQEPAPVEAEASTAK